MVQWTVNSRDVEANIRPVIMDSLIEDFWEPVTEIVGQD